MDMQFLQQILQGIKNEKVLTDEKRAFDQRCLKKHRAIAKTDKGAIKIYRSRRKR